MVDSLDIEGKQACVADTLPERRAWSEMRTGNGIVRAALESERHRVPIEWKRSEGTFVNKDIQLVFDLSKLGTFAFSRQDPEDLDIIVSNC